jgi:hypothetical protein
MFVRYYTELALPVDQVRTAAARLPQDWLPRLAEAADARTDGLLVEIGFDVAGLRLKRQGMLETSEWVPAGSGGARIHLAWTAAQQPGLFPSVDAELEVAPVGPRRTQLGLSAQYDPPLGLLGRTLDRTLLHRLAEAVAKDFVEAAAEELRVSVADRFSN